MARAKAKAKFSIIDTLSAVFDPNTARQVGKVVIKGIKSATAKGRSPVKGFGFFRRPRPGGHPRRRFRGAQERRLADCPGAVRP